MTNTGPKGKRVLIGATGSVAMKMLPTYITALRSELGASVTVLMTETAATFLPPQTVGLVADRVVSGESPAEWPTEKPSRLVGDHDLLVVLPATANILSCAATGAAPNRLATVILGANFPVLYFPVMGNDMWAKPVVQRNVKQIREDGQHVVEPPLTNEFDAFAEHPSLPSPSRVNEIVRKSLDV